MHLSLFNIFSDYNTCTCGLSVCSFCLSPPLVSTEWDVSGSEGFVDLGLHPGFPHYAGAQIGWKGNSFHSFISNLHPVTHSSQQPQLLASSPFPLYRCSGTGSSSFSLSGFLMASSSSCSPSRWQAAASRDTTRATALQTCACVAGTWQPCCWSSASAWRCAPSWKGWPTWSWRLCAYHCGPC